MFTSRAKETIPKLRAFRIIVARCFPHATLARCEAACKAELDYQIAQNMVNKA
jgi:hypothetical protein